MAPKLYQNIVSPPVRAVQMCASALGVDLEPVEMDFLQGDHVKPEYVKLNPLHTVPTLVDDDGFIVSDSHAIMPYLVRKYGKNNNLYPDDPKKQATINQRLHFDTGILFARGSAVTRAIFVNGLKVISQEAKDAMIDAYGFVEKYLEKSKYVAGDELTIADFSIVTSLLSWDLIITPLDRTKFPKTAEWLKRMESLPYFEKTNKEGLKMYKALIDYLLTK